MNRAYKLVWNTAQQAWTVASELAKGKTKTSGKGLKVALTLVAGLAMMNAHAAIQFTDLLVLGPSSIPTGESVVSGAASFDRNMANQLTINQNTSKLITNWSSFDVAANGKVIFAQPDSTSIALNRITTGSPTQILGQVQANGRLVIVNPNGITFGAGSQVSAASIIGSVLDIQDSDFNNGTLMFNRGNAIGAIDNQGSLTATAGSVTLLAPSIKNGGSISAAGGNASLINADTTDLTAVDPAITNSSSIAGLIKNSGSLQATQLNSAGGKILLQGDSSQSSSTVELTGSLNAEESNVNAQQINVAGVLDVNGTNNILKLISTASYNLSFGSKINLNGVSSGFSVNGTAYTVIRDVNQLQAMSNDLAGKYVLANDVDASDTVNWNGGAGFAPVGDNSSQNSASRFSGVLDGLGHTVDGLNINRPAMDFVGLFGYAELPVIKNIGINANISGYNYVGGLVGRGDFSSISNSYATGSVNGGGIEVGGLVGLNLAGSISNSYATGSVSGGDEVGGLVGKSDVDSISNSYAAGSVSGGGGVGGLIGYNFNAALSNSYATASVVGTSNVGGLAGANASGSMVSNCYATGSVSGSSQVGGLFGYNNRPVTNSYWDVNTSGKANAVGFEAGDTLLINGVGLTSSQMKNLASFANWSSIDAQGGTGSVWRIYEGQTAPLLRSFLKPLTATVNNATKTYDGTNYSGGNGYSLSNPVAVLLGGAAYGGTSQGARNAGTYSINLPSLYSSQQGYDLKVVAGSLNINKANLTISSTDVTKTYDGTTIAAGNAVVGSGQLFDTDSIGGGTFIFDNKNAGIGKHVTVSGVTVNDGNNSDNYKVIYADNTNSSIDKANLVITTNNVTKAYDGTSSAKGKAVATAGTQVFVGDTLTGGTFAFADKNAGTGKTVTTTAVTVNDGNGGNNYNISYADNVNSIINKRLLTIAATAVNKVYDGKLTTGTDKPLVTGRQRGDSISSLSQSFLDKNVGTGKTVRVNSGYVVNDGNGGNNYDVVLLADNVNGVVTPRTLTISTVANTKVYDGSVKAANKPLVTGLATGDRLTGLFQQYETKTVGTGKKLLIKTGYVVNDGNSGNNYLITEQTSTDGVITAH